MAAKPCCNPLQVGHQQAEEFISGGSVAFVPTAQQDCNVLGIIGHALLALLKDFKAG